MTILRFDDAPVFDLSGVRIRGPSSPARSASETMTSIVELGEDQGVPDHTHDHEGVSHLAPGGGPCRSTARTRSFGSSFTQDGVEAMILTSMPVGTLLIRPDGERVAPPWGT
jgi:hypothetical protein